MHVLFRQRLRTRNDTIYHGDKMELYAIAPKDSFLSYVQEHPSFLRYVLEFDERQKNEFVMRFHEEELVERAIAFFDSEDIYVKDHILFYENKLRSITYKIRIESHHIVVYDSVHNPFLPFLSRIYRKFLTYEISDDKETNIKVL